jgi:integrase
MSNALSLRVPKYRHHKGKGLAVVTLGGKDRYLGKYGSPESHEEYRRLIAEWSQRGNSPPPSKDEPISIAELMLAYLRHAQYYYRKRGEVTREYELIRDCCKLIKPLYGNTPAEDFGPLRLKAVRQQMIDAGHSRKYINKNIDRIRRMFKWTAAEELISGKVALDLSMVTGLRRGRTEARETQPVLPVDDSTVESTLPHLPRVVADMVRLQRLTGMRPQEICALRPCDIDRSGNIWIYVPEFHKTEHHGRERKVFMGPKAKALLHDYLDRDSQSHCFRPCDSEAIRQADRHRARSTVMSCGNRPGSNRVNIPKRKAGNHYSSGAYRRAIHRGCDKAFPAPPELTGEEAAAWHSSHRWSPNQLRHTAATEIRRNYGLEAAQIILGHAQADVTQIYAERDIAKGLEVASQIG